MPLALLGTAACGSEEAAEPEAGGSASEAPSETPDPTDASPTGAAPEGSPACADLWEDGNKLPRTYKGCADDAGALAQREGIRCSSGQVMVTFEDRYYGVLGGTIKGTDGPLEDDRDYRSSIRSCRA